jgi:hypothetical protein
MVQRRPEGMGGKAITDYRSLESAGITSAIEQIGGWGKALIKKDIKDAIVRGQAKQMVALGDKLKVSRAKGDGNNTRFELINTHIKQYLKGGGEPEVAIWLRGNMQHKDLKQVLGRDNVVYNVDDKGVIWGQNSERVPQPQSATPEKGLLEDAHEFEQAKNAEVRVLAKKSTAAFAAFGSGLENVDEYVVDGGELTDRVSDAMKFILGKKGQILYKDLTSLSFVKIKETRNFAMLQARLEGVFSEFLPMAARAIDDTKNTVNPGSVKQFARAIKGDVIDSYNKTPGARLAFGENFISEVNTYFDGVDKRIDSFIDGQFAGTKAKTTFEALEMNEGTVKLMQSLEKMGIWKELPKQLKEIDVMGHLMQSMVNLTNALANTAGVEMMKEGFVQALAPHMRHTIDSARKDLRAYVAKKATPAGDARIEDLIQLLLSNPAYINMGGDFEEILEEVTSIIDKIKMDPSTRSKFNASIRSYRARATDAGPPMKTWLDKLQDFLGGGADSGSATMQKFIKKIKSK